MYNEKGESAIPVFTDSVQMQRWRPEGGLSVTMKAVDVFRTVLQSPASAVVVNISGREPWIVPRALLRILADKMIPKGTEAGVTAVKLEVAEASEFEVATLSRPLAPNLLAAVEEGLRQNASLVRAAYAVNIGFNKNPPRPAIGLLFVGGTDSKTADETIGRILRLLPVMPEGQSLDFWALSPKYLARVQAVAKPFFPSG